MSRHSALLLVAIATFGITACNKRVAEPARGIAARVPAELPAPAKAAAEMDAELEMAAANDPAVHGQRKKVGIEVPVFVDGKPVAVLRYGELPRNMELLADPEQPKGRKYLYRLQDYLTSVGVNVAAIQTMHLRDLREKVVTVEGAELRRDKNRFMFAFMQGTTGIAHTQWSTEGLKDGLHIDEIAMINIYAKTPAAEVDRERHCYVKEGQCTSELPAGLEAPKGTRVYLDHRFLGYVKRRSLSDSMIVGRLDDGSYRYSLAKFAAGVGVNDGEIANVEITSGDEVVARLDKKSWIERRDQYSFELGKHQHGKVKILLGADVQAAPDEGASALKDEKVEVTSLQFYRAVKGTQRTLTPLADLETESLPQD